jgi:predicted phage-related endonuclease
MVRREPTWTLGYSPDGLVGDDGLIEVKSRAAKKQLSTILADEVPAENVAQCQAGLLVSGREWLDYVSFCAGMPLYRKRVYPDQRWFDSIVEAVEQFEEAASAMIARYEAVTLEMPLTERVIEQDIIL